jgi:hypothetical protein
MPSVSLFPQIGASPDDRIEQPLPGLSRLDLDVELSVTRPAKVSAARSLLLRAVTLHFCGILSRADRKLRDCRTECRLAMIDSAAAMPAHNLAGRGRGVRWN